MYVKFVTHEEIFGELYFRKTDDPLTPGDFIVVDGNYVILTLHNKNYANHLWMYVNNSTLSLDDPWDE